MASFTDEIQKFNPYIEQLPVDDFVKVGMAKQSQYQAGVQSIQQGIDQVAGLPLLRDVDKAYVKSAMSKLQEKIQSSGATDFSNQHLVGQITSATKQIGKDRYVQSAVSSAMFHQKQSEMIEKLRQEGKSSPENEWDYANALSKYTSSQELGQTFNYAYTPYRDVKKKAIDIIATVTKNPNIQEIESLLNPDGSLSDAALVEKFKGVDPNKIKAALLAGLDEGDMKQLSISGRYSMANYDVERLKGVTIDYLAKQKTFIATKKKEIEDTKSALTSTVAQQEEQAKIDALTKEEEAIDAEERRYRKMLDEGNLDGLRSDLYAQQFLNQFGNAFSFSEYSRSYKDNPAVKVALERAKLEQDWKTHTENKEAKKKEEEALYGGIPGSVDQSQLPDVTVEKFREKTEGLEKDALKEESEFLKLHGKDAQWLKKQRELYDQGKALEPTVMDYFQTSDARNKELNSNKQLLLQLEKDADKNIGTLTDLIPEELKGQTLTIKKPSGELSFTTEEFIEFNRKWNKVYDAAHIPNINSKSDNPLILSERHLDEAAEKTMTAKEKYLYQVKKANHYNRSDDTPTDRIVLSRIDRLQSAVNDKQSELIKKRADYINAELRNRTGETQRVEYTLDAGKGEDRYQIRSRVNGLVSRASDVDDSFGSDTNRANLSDIETMNDDEKTTYSLQVKGKTAYSPAKYWLRMKNGENKYQDIPISPADKKAIFGDMFEGDQKGQAANPIVDKIRVTQNGSTNFNGTSDPIKGYSSAYLNKTDFGGINTFSVKGDVISQRGKYALVLYIYHPEQKTYIRKEVAHPRGLVDEAQLTQLIGGMSDAAIYQLLYDKAPTAEDLKKIQEINKKANN